jgi:hypothetical protein
MDAIEKQPNGCWLFLGETISDGFQDFQPKNIVFETTHGPIPRGKEVFQSCADKRCCISEHLFLRDKEGEAGLVNDKKGLKLTAENVLEIRASSESGAALAARYEVSRAEITYIRNRKHWRHV